MSDGTKLIGVIGDEDTVTGFILAGVGHRTAEGTNFLVVKPCAWVGRGGRSKGREG
jgi:V-type H+-transporting ATPase subunit F